MEIQWLSSEAPSLHTRFGPFRLYYLFPTFKGRKRSSTEEATLVAGGWFAAQPKEFFVDGLKKLEQ
jgi:hypothetical protein